MRAGQLIEISSGNRHAVVTEAGATLYRVNWDGVEILDITSQDGYAGSGCHGQLLVPWPGRIPDGRYQFEGQPYQLPINDHTHHAAIHGWLRWASWQVREHGNDRVVLGYRQFATPGYPYTLELEQSYQFGRDGLECSLAVRNVGDATAPFGFGHHPYFTLGDPVVDRGLLQVPAAEYFEAEHDLTPKLPSRSVDGTKWDYRELREVGPTEFDITYTALQRGPDGKATTRFCRADGSLAIAVKCHEPLDYLQVYSGDTLSEAKRAGLAIEPQTCPPNAFNHGLGLARMAPGSALRLQWSLSVS